MYSPCLLTIHLLNAYSSAISSKTEGLHVPVFKEFVSALHKVTETVALSMYNIVCIPQESVWVHLVNV